MQEFLWLNPLQSILWHKALVRFGRLNTKSISIHLVINGQRIWSNFHFNARSAVRY